MDNYELVRYFVLFRDRRDTDAPAKVFDRLAPGLLRVARHLTMDLSLAEDLLQATFLTAMEKASAFDESRPLRPWLTGIVQLHARKLYSCSARIPAKACVDEAQSDDPSAILERRELEEEVERAFESLPERYRRVLVSRFELGLPSKDIAHRTGSKPGVVCACRFTADSACSGVRCPSRS